MIWKSDFIYSESFLSFLEMVPEAVIISNESGQIVIVNDYALSLFAYDRKTFLSMNVDELVPDHMKDQHQKMRAWFFQNPKPRFLKGRNYDLCAKKSNGDLFPMDSALFAIQTDEGAVAVNLIRDLSEEQKNQQEIADLAFLDSLTKLPNRRYFQENLKRNLARAERNHQHVALLYLDLDKFKPINDQQGHQAGDLVLLEVAKRMGRVVRGGDFVARIGGDEFVVMLYPLDSIMPASKMAERLVSECAKVIEDGDNTYSISASIGVVLSNEQDKTMNQLLHRADKAMYAAKEKGGNQYFIA